MDCLEGMKQIPDGSIDMILCDPPYGTTNCKWDSIIPFGPLWEQYERIIKPRGAMVFTAAQPFTTTLINSNRRYFRYCWYWIKNQVTGFPFAKIQPLRCIEDVVVFYKQAPTYNAQGLIRVDDPIKCRGKKMRDSVYHVSSLGKDTQTHYKNYPRQALYFKCERGLHPTQKPVELFEYLIRTYTNQGEIVLDNCMGSGTTAVACINTGRNYIGFEKDPGYYEIAKERIKNI
jgi:site-specific DNA-methyltransferase (adenine-specific)